MGVQVESNSANFWPPKSEGWCHQMEKKQGSNEGHFDVLRACNGADTSPALSCWIVSFSNVTPWGRHNILFTQGKNLRPWACPKSQLFNVNVRIQTQVGYQRLGLFSTQCCFDLGKGSLLVPFNWDPSQRTESVFLPPPVSLYTNQTPVYVYILS